MPTTDEATNSERQQTDESLRIEREKADLVFSEGTEAFDEVADSVITLARLRADEVLAAARAKVDGSGLRQGPLAAPLLRARQHEDQVLQHERDAADEVLREERAEHVALLASERNETDRDLVQERERADDALASRDEFLAIVSHDLRTLLNTVLGFAGLITQEVERDKDSTRVVADAQRIQRAGSRMNRLIGDLVDVASIQAGSLAVTRRVQSPVSVVQEAIDTFMPQATARGISLQANLIAPLPSIAFDAARILQVLGNLLSNAVKFTPREGTVVLRVEQAPHDLQFSVSDTGPGIPADRLEEIFNRYVQVRSNDRRGVGLGLYISRCIVLGHGGRIWAESTRDQGTRVCFTLPR